MPGRKLTSTKEKLQPSRKPPSFSIHVFGPTNILCFLRGLCKRIFLFLYPVAKKTRKGQLLIVELFKATGKGSGIDLKLHVYGRHLNGSN